MRKPWSMVKLGEVIRHHKDFVRINDLSTYKRCRVQLHAKGIVLRDLVTGSELKTKEQQICRSGDFLVAEIDAKVGGYGIVPDELDGAIVSSHYFLFEVDRTRFDRNFLGYFIKTPEFFDQVSARGTTNYAAIRPSHVLGYQIPLPPLEEQRRVVAKINELVNKIEEARNLRRRTIDEIELFLASQSDTVFKMRADWKESRVGDFCETPQYGFTTSARTEPVGPKLLRITDIQDGDVKRLVTPEYLYRYFQTPSYWSQIIDEKKGTGQPNVNAKKLANVRVPIPPPDEQRRLVGHLDDLQVKVKGLKELQVQTDAELNALMPSILDKAFKGEL
jgi:type I restriction enzyme S subunit